MILICPQCRAKSRVNGGRAQQAGARVRCGGCQSIFYAAEAKQDRVGIDARTAAALARARQSTGLKPKAGRWQKLATPLALAALLALVAIAIWNPLPNVGPSGDLTAQVQAAPPAAGAQVVIEHIEALAYAPTGGPEGLLVRGSVRNGGDRPVPMPTVVLDVSDAGSGPKQVRLRSGPKQTLDGAASLSQKVPPEAAAENETRTTLAPGKTAPFIGWVSPKMGDGLHWQVQARPED